MTTLGCLKSESESRARRIMDRRWFGCAALARQPGGNEFCLRSANHKPAVSRASVEWVAYHVAFEDSGVGCSIGHCCGVRARRMVVRPASLRRHRRRLGRDRFRPLARRPSRQFHRRSEGRDGAGADLGERRGGRFRRGRRCRQSADRRFGDWRPGDWRPGTGASETGACEATAAPLSVAIAASRSGSAPVIYLSKNGPADYRIFVRSKTFTARDAAALIVGAGDGHHHVIAASL